MTARNLILIYRGAEYDRDFDDIASRVIAQDPAITVYYLQARLRADLPPADWGRPTLTISLAKEFALPVLRGPVLRNQAIPKLEQQASFRAGGVPTPPAMAFRPGMMLDPIMFGEFVLIKPMDLALTSREEGITVFRRKRLEAMRREDFPARHPIHRDRQGYIVQRFVDTGAHPSSYRATTFLGAVLSLEKITLDEATPPRNAPDEVIEAANFTQKGKRHYELVQDKDLLALARKTAACFPGLPLLGIDLIRDMHGALHVLEVNAGGNTWHYSSAMFSEERSAMPDYYRRLREQFGVFDVAARALVEKVHTLAA